jgi:hypothetical protein
MLGGFGARFELLRPRSLARTSKSVDALMANVRELRHAVKALVSGQERTDDVMATLTARIEALAAEARRANETIAQLTAREAQLRAVIRADVANEDALPTLPAVLDRNRIATHVRAAIGCAQVRLDPFPHAIVPSLFPADFYAALLRGIPPIELFEEKAPNKPYVNVPLTIAPGYSRRVWNFMVYVVQRTLQPLVIDKFRDPLRDWIARNWPALTSDPFAPPMEFNMADGRIMMRGRGYRITPHRDPKWGFLTCILYLAREQDSEQWGTQLYSVDDDGDAVGAAPHWIEPQRCRLVEDVPFRPNTMLVMLNSKGAHGASIPDDAEPADLRRYIYQFRIGPNAAAIPRLNALLPADRRPLWTGKTSMV